MNRAIQAIDQMILTVIERDIAEALSFYASL